MNHQLFSQLVLYIVGILGLLLWVYQEYLILYIFSVSAKVFVLVLQDFPILKSEPTFDKSRKRFVDLSNSVSV